MGIMGVIEARTIHRNLHVARVSVLLSWRALMGRNKSGSLRRLRVESQAGLGALLFSAVQSYCGGGFTGPGVDAVG